MMEEKKVLDKEQSVRDANVGEVFTDGYYTSIVFANSRPYYFHTYDDTLEANVKVVVETVRGIELGTTTMRVKPISELKSEIPLKSIIRIATEYDIKAYQENLKFAEKAMVICKEAVKRLNLDMNLLSSEYTLDRTKVIFLYASENRVDFRELLKDLASSLHCRIELRQIGSRDRSKLIGGIGACGLPLCCHSFLGEFDGISINMAKNQFLALNIQKLSGHCGKLLCCLKYEDEQYTELREGLPKIGFRIFYDHEQYKITSINVLTGDVRIENPENTKIISLDEVRTIMAKGKNKHE